MKNYGMDIDKISFLATDVMYQDMPWFLLEEPKRSVARLISSLKQLEPYESLAEFDFIEESKPLVNKFVYESDYVKLFNMIDRETLREKSLGFYTPIMGVVCNKFLSKEQKEILIDKLIQNGEYINDRNEKGETALLMAIKRNNREMIELLLRRFNADPNIGDEIGITPLMVSVYNNNLYNVSLLYHYGADLWRQCCIYDLTAFDIADIEKCLETQALLKELEKFEYI